MSFGWSAAAWMAVSTAVGAAASVVQADKARRSQNQANDAARARAEQLAAATTRAENKAGKAPDLGALLGTNALANKSGAGSTLLTGPQGVDPSRLTLGRNTLLGGG